MRSGRGRHGRRGRIAIAVLAALVAGAAPTSPPAAVAGPTAPRAIASAAIAPTCTDAAARTWAGSAELVALAPDASATKAAIAGATNDLASNATCRSGLTARSTLDFLVDWMEAIASEEIDKALLANILAQADDITAALVRERSNLARIDQLTPAEQTRMTIVMQSLGQDASRLEARLLPLGWQTLPAVITLGALKVAAYALSAQLSTPGAYRTYLRDVVIPAEVDETRALVVRQEAEVVGYTVWDLELLRSFRSYWDGPYKQLRINALAEHGLGAPPYAVAWSCKRHKLRPNQCHTYEGRRTEFLEEGRKRHQAARSKALKGLGTDYLRFKNSLDLYRGETFLLANNRPAPTSGPTYNCLDVPDEVGARLGSSVLIKRCQVGADGQSLRAEQRWRIIRGSGQVQHVVSGLCLGAKGTPAQQKNGVALLLETCDTLDQPELGDQQWGIHPLGYLVNLATGRCLDLDGAAADHVGAQALVHTCEYELSPAYGARGASHGYGRVEDNQKSVSWGDPYTDQSWSMVYLGEGLGDVSTRMFRGKDAPEPVYLLTPPPPGSRQPPTDPSFDLPPIAEDDTAVVAQDGVVTVDVRANDISLGHSQIVVQSVGTPAHGSALLLGSGTVEYRPAAGYCNDPGGTPDTFTYRLAGGDSGTVSVRVTCNPVPVPVPEPDPVPEPQPEPEPEPVDTVPPDTVITTAANIFGQNFFGHQATMAFSSPEGGVTFQCRLDTAAFAPCASGASFYLPSGKHEFYVRAVDAAGNVDPTPARRTLICTALF